MSREESEAAARGHSRCAPRVGRIVCASPSPRRRGRAGDHRGESGSRGRLRWSASSWQSPPLHDSGSVRRRQSPTAQFAILPPNGTAFAPDADTVAVAPDGRSVVFAAGGSDAPWQLWLRSVDGLNVRPLAGTEGARRPFWSGDGKSIGFFADGKLKRVDAGGGPVRTLADVDAISSTGRNVEQRGNHPFRPKLRTTHCAHLRQWRRIDRGHECEGRRDGGAQQPLLPSGRSSFPLLGGDWSQYTCRLLRVPRRWRTRPSRRDRITRTVRRTWVPALHERQGAHGASLSMPSMGRSSANRCRWRCPWTLVALSFPPRRRER